MSRFWDQPVPLSCAELEVERVADRQAARAKQTMGASMFALRAEPPCCIKEGNNPLTKLTSISLFLLGPDIYFQSLAHKLRAIDSSNRRLGVVLRSENGSASP